LVPTGNDPAGNDTTGDRANRHDLGRIPAAATTNDTWQQVSYVFCRGPAAVDAAMA
jgi:hypothetical protein